MRAALVSMVLACLLGAAAQAAQVTLHRPVSTIFDLYLGGIRIGELSVNARMEGDRYRAASTMRTAGVVGALYAASFVAETEGTVGPRGLAPRRFVADTRAGGDVQAVEMRYEGPTPAQVKADPPFKPKPWEIRPEKQAGTVDPITAALMALAPAPVESLCRKTVDIYDGRRRYAVDLGAPVAEGERIRCPAVYRRIAGYKPKELKEGYELDIWFEERADGLAHVVRAAGESGFGLAVMMLRE